MSNNEKLNLEQFAKLVLDLGININSMFRTRNNDYEIVTYVDEVQILDTEEMVLVSVKKDEAEM